MSSSSSQMAAESTMSSPLTELVEVALSLEEKKFLTTVDLPLEAEANILEKGTLTPEEKSFLGKKRNIEKKMMRREGEYSNLREMATDINDGTPSKEIEDVVFRNIMKIMLNEFKN